MADYQLSVEVSGDASKLKNGFKEAQESLSSFKNKTESSSLTVGKLAKAFGIAQIATKAVSSAIGIVTDNVGNAINRFDTLNNYPKVLQSLGYSADEAKASMATLSDGIDGLPTSLDEITGSTQRMVTILGDVPKATKSTIALNNAFLASGASSDKASRGMEQYMQMLAAGKVDQASWNTLIDTMPMALTKTAEAFGFTGRSAQKEFYEALKSGDITMDQFNDKLIELNEGTRGFAEVAKTASAGIGTSFKNLGNAVTKNIEKIITAVNEWAQAKGLGSIAENIDGLKGMINNFGAAVVAVTPQIMDFLYNLGQKGMEAFKQIEPYIPPIIDGLKELAGVAKEVFNVLAPHLPLIFQLVAAWVLFNTALGAVTKVTGKINALSSAIMGIGKSGQVIKDLGGAFSGLKGVIAGKFETIYLEVLYGIDDLKSLMGTLGEGLKSGLVEAFGGLKDVAVTGGGLIKNGFLEAMSALKNSGLLIFNGLKTGIMEAMGAIKDVVMVGLSGLKSGFTALWGFFAANPIALVVVSIMAVVAALIYAYQHFESFRNLVDEVVQAVVGFFTNAWEELKTNTAETTENLKATFSEFWVNLTTGFSTMIETIKSFFVGLWTGLTEGVALAWETVTTVISEAIINITTVASELWEGFKLMLSGVWQGVQEIATIAFEGLKAYLSTTTIGMIFAIVTNWQGFIATISAIWNSISSTASAIWESIKTKVVSTVTNTKDLVTNAYNTLKSNVLSIVTGVYSAVVGKFEEIKGRVVSIATSMKDQAIRAWEGMKSGASKVVGMVRSAFEALRNINLFNIGNAIIQGFLNGLKAKFEAVKSFVGGIGPWIQAHKGPIQYDKRLLIPAGYAIIEGLNKGLKEEFKETQRVIQDITDTIEDVFDIDVDGIDFGGVSGGTLPTPAPISTVGSPTTSGKIREYQIPRNYFVYKDYDRQKDMNITVVSELDGREVARGTYKYTNEYVKRQERIKNRRRGEI